MEPQINTDEHRLLTERIIRCAFKVSNVLGSGFLEKVYENALAIELRKNGLRISMQRSLKVYYEGILVGEYTPDIIVNDQILLELKAVKSIEEIHKAQILNYLRISKLRIGLILNFGTPKLGIKRMIL